MSAARAASSCSACFLLVATSEGMIPLGASKSPRSMLSCPTRTDQLRIIHQIHAIQCDKYAVNVPLPARTAPHLALNSPITKSQER